MNLLALLAAFELTGNVWAVISRALPVAIRLVKALDSDEATSGKEKFQKVLTSLLEELDKEGFIVDEKFDSLLNFSIEFALLITRHGKETKITSITPKPKPKKTIGGDPSRRNTIGGRP